MFPYLRHSDNVTKLVQVTQPLRSQTSKTQEFGVRKGSLMEKAPMEKATNEKKRDQAVFEVRLALWTRLGFLRG